MEVSRLLSESSGGNICLKHEMCYSEPMRILIVGRIHFLEVVGMRSSFFFAIGWDCSQLLEATVKSLPYNVSISATFLRRTSLKANFAHASDLSHVLNFFMLSSSSSSQRKPCF